MQVHLAVHGLSFQVACGEGMQSIKWLGLVAAQRYALVLPHGRCRTREDAHSKNGFYLPSDVRNSEGATLSPWSRIVECCRENETITVTLQLEVPVDNIGVPQLTQWATSAFMIDNNQHHNETITNDDNKEMDENDPTTSKSRKNSFSYDNLQGYSSSFHANHVKSGQFITQEELENAFYHDVGYLKLDEYIKEPKDRDEIEDILLKYYENLVMIFKHYSLGFGEDSYSMNFIEFTHFIHETTMLNYVKDGAILDKIYMLIRHEETTTLSRVDFIQGLIHVIVTNNKMYGDDLPFSIALDKGMQNCVKPACMRLISGPFRDNLHSDGILSMFQESKAKISKVYEKYASGKSPRLNGPVLSVADLRSLIQDSGIFCTGDSDRHEELFIQATLQCFSGMKEIKDGEKQYLVLVEFLEVICRIALAIWDDKDVTPKETIRIGLDAVRALAKRK